MINFPNETVENDIKEFNDETSVKLQKKLDQQTNLIRHITEEAKNMMNRKSEKLKELIEYIQTLHDFIAKLGNNPDLVSKLEHNLNTVNSTPAHKSVYIDVEERVIDPNDPNIAKQMT